LPAKRLPASLLWMSAFSMTQNHTLDSLEIWPARTGLTTCFRPAERTQPCGRTGPGCRLAATTWVLRHGDPLRLCEIPPLAHASGSRASRCARPITKTLPWIGA
jgi:hypothetical protein